MTTDKQKWLDEALDLCPDQIIRDEAAAYLAPLLPRCRSNSRKAFWQWLRLSLAKTQDSAIYLTWLQESKLRLPVEQAKDGFKYIINGDVALIDVVSGDDHAVWRSGVRYLDWALGLYPTCLKRLPNLESLNAAEIRKQKRKVAKEMPFLTPAQRAEFERCISELEDEDRRAYPPVPRFMLIKYENGRANEVHRMFACCGDAEMECINGDWLDFGTTTLRVTMSPVNCGWVRPRQDCTTEITVPNLQIMNDKEAQQRFEAKAFMQLKLTAQGDVDETPLRVMPNSGIGGEPDEVTAAGSAVAVTEGEVANNGKTVERVSDIRRSWRVHRGSRRSA